MATSTTETTSFTCKNCGATTSAVALGSSIRCPFCGSEHVIAGPEDASAPRPEALIPFAFPDDQVEQVYRQWLGEGFFRPKDITAKANSHKMRAVYVPVWESQANARSEWHAQAGYTEQVPAPPPPPGNKQTDSPAPTTRTRWEHASGRHTETYDRVLISGSKGLPQNWLGRLGDLDWGQIRGYDPNYLLGREVEASTLDRPGALAAARTRIEELERSACANLVPGDTHRDLRVSTEITELTSRLVFLPVWLASFQYNDKTYRCVVNGQSGKVDGEAPLNPGRVAMVVGGILVVIAVIVILVMVLG